MKNHNGSIALFVSMLFCSTLISQVETSTVIAEYDVAIGFHDGYQTENNNYDEALQNAAYCIPGDGTLGGLNVNRCLIYFDLSFIPEGSEITNAYVSLYALGPISDLPGHMGPQNQCFLERIIEPWSEISATWNNQPQTTSADAAILPATSDYTLDYDSIVVTDMVQEMVMVAGNNHGFKLRLENEETSFGLLFRSLETNDPSRHPSLTVTYKERTNSVFNQQNSSNEISAYLNSISQLVINVSDSFIGKGVLLIHDLKGALVHSFDVNFSQNNQTLTLPNLDSAFGFSFGILIMENGTEQSFRIIAP